MSAAPSADAGPPGSSSAAPSPTFSPTVSAMLADADDAAVGDGSGPIGLRHLILGAVRVGRRERGSSAPLFAATFAEAVEAHAAPDLHAALVGRAPAMQMARSLSPMAQSAIDQARTFSRLATGEDFVAARHLIIALTFPLRPDLRAAVARVWRTNWNLDVATLRAPLAAAMERELRAGEDRSAWRTLFGTSRDAPAFSADAPHPAATDPLGYAEDARRLAELTCLKANEPPMAVALFGDWGAGKSTFMRRMQAAVEDIGTTWRGDADSPFCARVAQVRFNAWSYADGDLWASLAAEIFRQLRGEIGRLSGEKAASAQYRALLDRVGLRLGAAEAVNRDALGALAKISRELEGKRDELVRLDRRAEEIAAAPASARLQARAEVLLADKPEVVAAALKTLGMLELDRAAQATALVGQARQAASLAGKARLAGRLAWRLLHEPTGWALLALGAGAAYVLPSALAWAGLAAPFVAWVVRLASPVLDAAAAFEQAEAAERASLAARRTTLEAEIATLRRDREAQEKAQSREAALLARYAGATGGESPAALLKFFVEQDSGAGDYENRLGLVSRLRESFETLEALLADQRKAPDGSLPAIDRIVLYVDDLDRCLPEQVVPVLQALALMLQLKLFVAVVAVDARWLNASLRIHFKALLDAQAMTGPEQFLEKIFQIPFWLPPMQAGAANRFGAFVAHLVPEAVAPPPATMPVSESWLEGTTPAERGPWTSQAAIDPDELPQPGDTNRFAHASKADRVASVQLTEPELAILSALAPLAGGTPRAVKRFVNLYRLARADRQGDALRAFLGQVGDAPEFAFLAFAMAWKCGSKDDAELPQILLRAGPWMRADLRVGDDILEVPLAAQVQERLAQLAQVWDAQEKQRWSDPAVDSMHDASLSEPRSISVQQLPAAVAALERAIGRPATLGDIARPWQEAARYSFRRPA
jgi:hypothetical protein